jgi:RNA polymerase sigma-70 factor (ECF subfamily)
LTVAGVLFREGLREGEPLDLVLRARNRDRKAFEMLVEQHAAAVHRLAAAIVGAADGADVAQESFVAAWQELPRLRNARAFEAGLRRSCVNRSRNWLRDRRRRPTGMGTLDVEADSLGDPRADFHSEVEARTILEPAFDRLGPDHRAVLALHYSIGLSIAETADALDIRVGTAKSRLNAALAALRRDVAAPLREIETDDVGTEATS